MHIRNVRYDVTRYLTELQRADVYSDANITDSDNQNTALKKYYQSLCNANLKYNFKLQTCPSKA